MEKIKEVDSKPFVLRLFLLDFFVLSRLLDLFVLRTL